MMNRTRQGLGLLASLTLFACVQAATPSQPQISLSTAEQTALIAQVRERLQAEYHDPSRLPGALAALTASTAPVDGPALAEAWTRVLQTQLGDAHARLVYSPAPLPAERAEDAGSAPSGPPPEMLRYMNCGVERAEHYPGNIGYLRLDGMAPPSPFADDRKELLGELDKVSKQLGL